jgi:hypothetical protein
LEDKQFPRVATPPRFSSGALAGGMGDEQARKRSASSDHGVQKSTRASEAFVKHVLAFCLSLLVTEPAHALCMFGIGTTCSIDNDTAAEILRREVNGKRTGSLTIDHTFLFDTLRHPELKPGDNARRLARAQEVRGYINSNNECSNVTSVWPAELPFSKSKETFCARAQLMKARNLALPELSIGAIRVTDAGPRTQDLILRLAMTEEGQARVDRFLISRDAESFTVSTGTLNFLRIVGNDGGAPVATVQFQYEIVPNAWTHVEKGMSKDMLAAERKMGAATFEKLSEQWQLIKVSGL